MTVEGKGGAVQSHPFLPETSLQFLLLRRGNATGCYSAGEQTFEACGLTVTFTGRERTTGLWP